MNELVEFFRARLDEDERQARSAFGDIELHDPARVLRGVEAKRRIMDRYLFHAGHAEHFGVNKIPQTRFEDKRDVLWSVLLDFVAVYDGHPDYLEEWRP